MPRKMSRIEPTWQRPTWDQDDEYTRRAVDAVPVNGHDPGAAHRAAMRQRTTAAQQDERRAREERVTGYQERASQQAALRGAATWAGGRRPLRERRER